MILSGIISPVKSLHSIPMLGSAFEGTQTKALFRHNSLYSPKYYSLFPISGLNPAAIIKDSSLVNSRRKAEVQLFIDPLPCIQPCAEQWDSGMNQIIFCSWGVSSLLGRQTWSQTRTIQCAQNYIRKVREIFLEEVTSAG